MPSSSTAIFHLFARQGAHCGLSLLLLASLGLTETVTGQAAAGTGADKKSQNQTLSEAQIDELLKRPLSLEDCLQIALSKNLQLAIARNQRDMVAASLSGSYGTYFPVLSINSSRKASVERTIEVVDDVVTTRATRVEVDKVAAALQQKIPTGATLSFINEIDRDTDNDERLQDLATHTYRVELAQPLLQNLGPKSANGAIRVARNNLKIEELNFETFRLQTIFAVKSAYYDVIRMRKFIGIHQAALRRDSLLVRASESKVMAKVATRRDVLSAEIRVQEDQAALLNAETDYQTALDMLKEQLGLAIALPLTIVEDTLAFQPPPLEEERWIKLALENSPALRAAALTIEQRNLQASLAGNLRLPQIDAIGSYSRRFDRDTGRDPNGSGWSVGFVVNYPFLDRGRAAEAEIARLERSRAEEAFLALQRQTVLSVRQIHRNLQNSIARIQVLDRNIAAAAEKVEFATTMFNMGRASNLDITDATEALLRAETAYIEELVDFHVQFALLESLTRQSFLN